MDAQFFTLLFWGIHSYYSLKSFKMNGLATYRAVTREQDPPALRGTPHVHTSSFALSVRWILNRLALPGANR